MSAEHSKFCTIVLKAKTSRASPNRVQVIIGAKGRTSWSKEAPESARASRRRFLEQEEALR
jgi:hypothetical protein